MAPARQPSATAGAHSDVTIAAARPDDVEAILSLEESAFPPGERWNRPSWAGELEGDAMHTLIAWRQDGFGPADVLGVLAIRLLGDQADLDRLMVAPAARRRGIGQTLLAAGLDAAAQSGAAEMILDVRTDNPAAIALYEGASFDTLSTRAGYYGPGADAKIMKRNLA